MSGLPAPFYQDPQVVLFHGDCRDILPLLEAGSVDCLLTDPPYGISWEGGSYRKRRLFGAKAGDDGTLDVRGALALALPALRKHRHVYCFGLDSFGALPITEGAELIWDKGQQAIGNLALPWGTSHERILFGVYAPSRVNREDGLGRLAARLRRGSVLRCDRSNGVAVTRHPTEKPVHLLRQLIESSTVWGDTVLDPFAGSGSTGVAAKLEGRRAVLIELEEKYCQIAAQRLAQQVLPLELGGGEAAG